MDLVIKSGNSMGITRKEMAPRKINNVRKKIESLLLKTQALKIKTRSPKLKTRYLVQKMIKNSNQSEKRNLREYSLKDQTLLSKD